MKYSAIVLAFLLFASLTSADTTRVVNGNVLNLYSLKKTQLKGTYIPPWGNYSPPCSLNTDTLKRYDFIYQNYDFCTCLCPMVPQVRITSPRPFYRSKISMNYNEFNPNLLATQFTKISGPDSAYAGWLTCYTLPSVTYGTSGASILKPIDSMTSRLFVFLSDDGGRLPYYQYMLVHIDKVLPNQYWCNPNEPESGGQYYPLYDTARISIYPGDIVSIKQTETPVYARVQSKDLNLFSIFGKRMQIRRIGELPTGIYIINGRLRVIQNSKPMFKELNSLR